LNSYKLFKVPPCFLELLQTINNNALPLFSSLTLFLSELCFCTLFLNSKLQSKQRPWKSCNRSPKLPLLRLRLRLRWLPLWLKCPPTMPLQRKLLEQRSRKLYLLHPRVSFALHAFRVHVFILRWPVSREKIRGFLSKSVFECGFLFYCEARWCNSCLIRKSTINTTWTCITNHKYAWLMRLLNLAFFIS